jgi:hypothetical protein
MKSAESAQDSFTTIVRGFDVLIESHPEKEATYKASVTEIDGAPWVVDIPVNLDDFEGSNEDLDGSNEMLVFVAQAAVDLYEARRGTLGQGAGALQEVQAMKREACMLYSEEKGSWFEEFKGTQFEQRAYDLLKSYIQSYAIPWNTPEEVEVEAAIRQGEMELDLLNLERMKNEVSFDSGSMEVVVTIGGGPAVTPMYGDDDTHTLDLFEGTPQYPKALEILKEVSSLKTQMADLQGKKDDRFSAQDKLRSQMNELLIEARQANSPDALSGPEGLPNMTRDMVSLMDGVELPMLAAGVSDNSKVAFDEVEPVEDRICERGTVRDDLDPALVDPEEFPFEQGDKVKLKEKVVIATGWGATEEFPKGTKGIIQSVDDGHGDCYQVLFLGGVDGESEDMWARLPADVLSKA